MENTLPKRKRDDEDLPEWFRQEEVELVDSQALNNEAQQPIKEWYQAIKRGRWTKRQRNDRDFSVVIG